MVRVRADIHDSFDGSGFNMDELDFGEVFRMSEDISFFDNRPKELDGVTYQDRLEIWSEIERYPLITFAGPSISYNQSTGEITGGTVGGIVGTVGNPFVGYYTTFSIHGLSVSARAIYDAGMTFSRADDLALIEAALAGDDSFVFFDGSDQARGYGGNDSMSGMGGNDRLYGGDGDDQFNGGAGMDYLVGGYGADTVVYSADAPSLSVTLQGSSEAVVSISGPNNDDTVISIENITGGDVGDRLIGDSRANELRGKGGNDVLSGREGDDRLYAGSGWDKLYGGSGQDHLFGGTDNAGDDFVFSSRSHSTVGSAHDVVYNFTRGSDNIDLRDIDARPSSKADDTFAWSDTAAAAHSVWWKATSEGVLLRADTTGNTTADFEVLLQGLTSFESGDVLL